MLWSFRILAEGKWPTHDWTGKKHLGMNQLTLFSILLIVTLLLVCLHVMALLLAILLQILISLTPHRSKKYLGTRKTLMKARRLGNGLLVGSRASQCNWGGDLDYLAKYLGLPRSSLHSNPCGMCKCTFHGVLSWMDNRECAAWIRSLVTVSNWKEHLKSDCILFQLAGLNALSIAFDWKHNACLGWLQYFYGSVLFFLVYHILPHDPLTNLIDTVAPFIKEYQKIKRWCSLFMKRHKQSPQHFEEKCITIHRNIHDQPMTRLI